MNNLYTPSLDQAPEQIVQAWLTGLNSAMRSGDLDAVRILFRHDAHWRDIVALRWTLGTISEKDAIAPALLDAARESGARDFRIDEERAAPTFAERAGDAVVEAILRFETAVGHGEGVVRIKRADAVDSVPRAWTLLTALQSIGGHDEETVRLSREEPPFERDWHGPNWLDRREEERRFADRDPVVLIVGGGHSGLSAAAALKAQGIDALVVDRMARIGDNWRNRYHSLKLHNKTPSNHLAYLPFPSTWPNYIAKDKIANWLELYVEALDINFWTRTQFEGATYDEAAAHWSARLRLDDGSQRVMRPRHIIMATSVSGTPNIPKIPTLENFSGAVVHSSAFRNGAEYKDRNVFVFGTGTSAHDITQDLHGHGAYVTMVQRSPTEVINIEPSAQLYDGIFYGKGPSIIDRDLVSASIPLEVMKQSHRLLTVKAREYDAPLHKRLQEAGFRLDFDEFGWPLKFRTRGGGYYFNVGGSDLIANKEVGLLQYHDIEGFEASGVRMRDGGLVPGELVVLATGYKGLDHVVRTLFGEDVSKRVGSIWGFDESQELRSMWMRTGQPGLWFTGGAFSQCRIYSKYLALQIKAAELGLLPA
ncbi:MAG: monooxygenase [Azorhizobium sp. 32-67-21]|uniref:flavin-containing monooxygenase n=1 Tax=Xanthobacter TaxID=279 RepID=UPI000BC99F69|nr:MAG: monooxygenase [Rhizobiales bacterium 12-68-15]OYX90563.1 MAG: monooxygenase [Azorhizobium sp. 32-67-21]